MDDDAPDIWKRLIVSTSPDEFFEALDSKEKTAISDWKERRLNILQRRIQEEVVAELETDTSLERKSTPFIRIKVASIIPSGKSKCDEALLTIWEPTEEQLQALKEGAAIQIQNLGVRQAPYDGLLQLTASNRTQMEAIDISGFTCNPGFVGHRKRQFHSLFQVHAISHKLMMSSDNDFPTTHWPDIDTVVVHVRTIVPSAHSVGEYRIFVTDESQLLLRIHCDETLLSRITNAAPKRKSRVANNDDDLYRVLQLCDLRILPFDYEEDCAVARFVDVSSLAVKTSTPRVGMLQRWASFTRKSHLQRVSLYLDARLTQWSRTDSLTAVGYILGLKITSSEGLHIEVDCGSSFGVEEWELPGPLLQKMILVAGGIEGQQVALSLEEESRFAELGVVGPILRARGILWRFQLHSKAGSTATREGGCCFSISQASPVEKQSLGYLYAYRY